MDLKFKGKTWVGNIYQRFEAMCQEVDDFVSKDKVKYVENQVHIVGRSVKKICSDVVEELIPSPLVDPVEHEAQAVDWKQKDTNGTYTRSMIGIEEKPIDISLKQSSAENDPFDPPENCYKPSSTGLRPAQQIIPLPREDPIKEADSDVFWGQDGEALIYKDDMVVEGSVDSDMGVEENVTKEERYLTDNLSSPEDEDLSEASLFSESIDENHNNGMVGKVSRATFVNDEGTISSPKEGTLINSFSDDVDCASNVSSSLQSSELALSIVSFENKVVETTLVSSSSSPSTEFYNLSEYSSANFPQKAEKICCDPTYATGCVSDLSGALSSSESFSILASNNTNADMGHAFSSNVFSLEPNDADNLRTDEAVLVAGSSGSKHEQCCKPAKLDSFMSSLEIGPVDDSCIDISDPSLETIDLSDNVKLDESCVIVDTKLLYAVSCRTGKMRSYKKIIQDAFASRKRLTKEYEQLAILYGDIDTEFRQHPKKSMLPSIATMSLESKKSPNQDFCDSEWELL